jgi:excisionase family DNA binding protein
LLTPPEVARQWRIKHDKVLTWIRSGELRAINVATKPGGRPSYRIDPVDLKAFADRRAAVALPRPPRRKGRRKTARKEYF